MESAVYPESFSFHMYEIAISVYDLMPSIVRADRWLTARNLHQIQVLSCDVVDLTEWTADDHCAPYWRIYSHGRTGAELLLGQRVMPLGPRSLVVIPPGIHFGSRLSCSTRQFFVSFKVEPAYAGPACRVISLPWTRSIGALVRTIIGYLNADALDLRTSLLAHQLIIECLKRVPACDWSERYGDARITAAVQRIRAAYPRRIPVRVLAREASMSTGAFCRLFMDNTGRSSLEYLENMRMDEACSLLHQSEATIDEITERLGFSDRAYFSRMFKKHMNCPPGFYRRHVNAAGRLRP